MSAVFFREGLRYRVQLNHWIPRLLKHDAWTFAGRICVADSVLPADLHCHEFQHVRQQHELGLVRFSVSYLLQAIRHGYRGISYEVEAYEAQAKPTLVATFAEVRA